MTTKRMFLSLDCKFDKNKLYCNQRGEEDSEKKSQVGGRGVIEKEY